MQHRIFIAINLPENIKKRLIDYQLKWPELPARWTKKENLHITLFFLGYLADQDLSEVCNIAKNVTLNHEPFSVNLTKICYGPPKKMPPRMVWVEGEKSRELTLLNGDLEKSLINTGSVAREFRPHITLGRIRTWQWRQFEPEERPEVEEEISLNFEVNSIEVMESRLKRGGPEYTTLESCNLKFKT